MNHFLFISLFFFTTDLSIKERLNISTEYDTNIYKNAQNAQGPLISDFDLRLQSDLNLKYKFKNHIMRSNLINGGKLFINETDANTLVNQFEFSYLFKHNIFSPEAGIEVKDNTTSKTIQDYSLIRPFVAINYIDDPFYIKLIAGYEKFIFDYNNNYSYQSPATGILSTVNIDDNTSLNFNYVFKYMFYESNALKKFGNIDEDTLITQKTENRREDRNHNFILKLNYESDILISITYNPEINSSNSVGESIIRQRFQISMSAMLFYKIYLNMLLSIMISSFEDGVLISDQFLLINDSENRNYIILKVSREIYKKIMYELKYGYYYSEYSNYITQFSRTVISTGICLKF